MKCLILAALVVAVMSDATPWEPTGDSPKCTMCGDPMLRRWTGVYTMIRKKGKYLLARFDDGERDPCKFQIRCVVSEEFRDDDAKEPRYVDWCGISVHQHPSPSADESNGRHTLNSKFFRRYLFAQRLDLFGVSGTGIKPLQARTNTIDDPLYFPRHNEKINRAPWVKNGIKKVPDPACLENGTPTYAIYIDPEDAAIRFRSYCCGWAVDFWPAGRDTCVSVYADMDNPFIQRVADKMEGLCGGDIRGTRAEDWSTCGVSSTLHTPNEEASMTAIQESCHEGDHDGAGFRGGTRLDLL